MMRSLLAYGMALFAGIVFVGQGAAQRGEHQPSLEFGGAQISLGMTVDQVKKTLSGHARELKFLEDGQTAIVHPIDAAEPYGDEGQVTFREGRVIYAVFQFPVANSSVELAQEIAGAIAEMDSRSCTVINFSSHGTGGGHSEQIFDCGPKSFRVMTIEPLGSSERDFTNVEIDIGSLQPAIAR